MKKTAFFDAADPAPERIVRNLAFEYVKVKTKVIFYKMIACAGMKHRPAIFYKSRTRSKMVSAIIPIVKNVLDGIRVIEITEALAGPYCAMLLGDLGADVIKVERPGIGDQARGWGPPFVGEMSAYFLSTNRNKRSIALDYKQPNGLEALHKFDCYGRYFHHQSAVFGIIAETKARCGNSARASSETDLLQYQRIRFFRPESRLTRLRHPRAS